MGQRIEIDGTSIVGDSVILTTNRSLTGTEGEGYGSADEAKGARSFGAKMASDLFEADPAIERVYVTSNVIIARRRGGWSQEAVDAVSRVVEEFFLYYAPVGAAR